MSELELFKKYLKENRCEYCSSNDLECDYEFPCNYCIKDKQICKYHLDKFKDTGEKDAFEHGLVCEELGPPTKGIKMETLRIKKSLSPMVMMESVSYIGFSVGGAKDIENFRENIKNNYLPKIDHITHEGIYYDYYFDTGIEKRKKGVLFYPTYSSEIDKHPLTNQKEFYMTVGLNSGITEKEFKRKDLNLVIVLDISGSMGTSFDKYHYDKLFKNKNVSAKELFYYSNQQERAFIGDILSGLFNNWTKDVYNERKLVKKVINDYKLYAQRVFDLQTKNKFKRIAGVLEERIVQLNLIYKIKKIRNNITDKREDYYVFYLLQEYIDAKMILNKMWNWKGEEYKRVYGLQKYNRIKSLYKNKKQRFKKFENILNRYYDITRLKVYWNKKKKQRDIKNIIDKMKILFNNIQKRKKLYQKTTSSKYRNEDVMLLANLTKQFSVSKNGDNDWQKSKMMVANECITYLIDKLNIDGHIDNLGIVLFDDNAVTLKDLSPIIDSSKLKDKILKIKIQGGTNIESGYKMGMKLFKTISEKIIPEKRKFEKLTQEDKKVIVLVINELKSALNDEFIASKQYYIDSEAYTGDKEIKDELYHHGDQEKEHADMIMKMLFYIGQIETTLPKLPTSPIGYNDKQILHRNLMDELKAVEDYEIILNKIDSYQNNTSYKMIQSILDDEKEHVRDLDKFIKNHKNDEQIKLKDEYEDKLILRGFDKKRLEDIYSDEHWFQQQVLSDYESYKKDDSIKMHMKSYYKLKNNEIYFNIINILGLGDFVFGFVFAEVKPIPSGDTDLSIVEGLLMKTQKSINPFIDLINEIKNKKSETYKALLYIIHQKENLIKHLKGQHTLSREKENRIVLITDAMPNIGFTGGTELNQMIEVSSLQGIYTTFIGVGIDFNNELIEYISKVKGANYYSVHSSLDFKKRLSDEFEYMVTPMVFDLKLKFESKGYEIQEVYGNPNADKTTGTLMHVNTLFPSRTKEGKTKGGVILLKLKGDRDDAQIKLSVSYVDRDGKSGVDEEVVNIQKTNTGIKKAILLSRYVNLIKEWITNDSRGLKKNQIGWESGSIDLFVGSKYKELFKKFLMYFEQQIPKIKDDILKQEVEILKKLYKFEKKEDNIFELDLNEFKKYYDIYIIFEDFKITPTMTTVKLKILNRFDEKETKLNLYQGSGKNELEVNYNKYNIRAKFMYLQIEGKQAVRIKLNIK